MTSSTLTAPSTEPAVIDRPRASRAAALWRGRADDSALVRPALLGLLVVTAALYLWSLGASGWANSFYAAAVQAGSESWKAFFFGSSDAASSITVDKTPLSLWPMALSARIFGMSSWAMLVPQALMGVGTVGLLYLSVRRATGNAWAGLFSGLAMALTPVAVLMFRFNNPDAALVLLMVAAVYATQRALESPTRAVRWIAFAGALVGLAFLAKMLQAFLVLPALATVYATCAPVKPLVRLRHLLIAFGSMIAAAGWWIAIVELWPATSRPYIGGSQNNSILELTLGYNGFGRLNGNETGSVGGGGGGGWGETGLFRLFDAEIGGQIAWLLPAALVLLLAGLWFSRRAGRTDSTVSGLVVWGGWLVVTALTFSFMAGIFHAYYTVALAPAAAAVIGIGSAVLWTRRADPMAAVVAGFAIVLTAATAFVLLDRSSDFVPWLRWMVIIAGVGAGALIVLHQLLPRRAVIAVAVATMVATLAGPTAFAVDTATTAHTGSIVSAGPGTGGGMGRGGGGGGGGTGSLLTGSESTSEITTLLTAGSGQFTWAAAAVGSNSASGYQLASGEPIMAIGGFNGSDPSPTLEQFQRFVADGQIHYFIAGGGGMGGRGGGRGTASEISSWVESTYGATTVDGVTLYDLTSSAS